jgi:DNA transposition AAA+ family ATPase
MNDKNLNIDQDPEVPEVYSGDNVRASWPFSLHTIRSNIAHCSPEGKEALVSAFLWCTDSKHPVTRDDFARRVGYSGNVIYKLLAGKYYHPSTKAQLDIPPDLVKNIREFLNLERDRWLGGRTQFIVTPTAKKIFLACDLARESQTPVFLTGRSHIGKTMALEHYAAANNHGRTSYTRMKAASGLGGMVRRIAEKHGVSPNGNTADLIDRIKAAITPDMCVILDEMHLLMYTYRRAAFFACLEVIREIYDETDCGMVLCGTRLLMDKVNEGKNGEMEQLLRRGVHRVVLPEMPTKADLAAIFDHHGLEFPKSTDVVEVSGVHEKPIELIKRLAKRDGLKSITERIRYARKLSAKTGTKLSWQKVVEADLRIDDLANPREDW